MWAELCASAQLLTAAAQSCALHRRAHGEAQVALAAHVCHFGLALSIAQPAARTAQQDDLGTALRARLCALGCVKRAGRCPAWEGLWCLLRCVLWEDRAARLLLGPAAWAAGQSRAEAAAAAATRTALLEGAPSCATLVTSVVAHWTRVCRARARGLSLAQLRTETMLLQADVIARGAPPPRRWRAATQQAAAETSLGSCASRFFELEGNAARSAPPAARTAAGLAAALSASDSVWDSDSASEDEAAPPEEEQAAAAAAEEVVAGGAGAPDATPSSSLHERGDGGDSSATSHETAAAAAAARAAAVAAAGARADAARAAARKARCGSA
jgi:hypothetical protein